MIQQKSLYIIPPILTAAVLVTAALYIFWRRRNRPASRTGALILLACAELMVAHTLEIVSPDLQWKIFWNKMKYIAFVTGPTAWLIYTLQYSGREKWLTWRNMIWLGFIPLITLLLAFTNKSHGLMWSNVTWDPNNTFLPLDKTYNIGIILSIVYSSLLMLFATLINLQLILHSRRLYRWQANALIFASLLPYLAFLFDLFSLSPFPKYILTSLGFILGSATVGLTIYRLRLGDIIPVARGLIIESMRDGVIVLDAQNRLIDMNLAAEKLIGHTTSQSFGEAVEDLWSDWPGSTALGSKDSLSGSEMVLVEGDERNIYDMRISPIVDWRGHLVSQVVVLRDITEHKKAAEALKKAHDELEDRVEERTTELSKANELLKQEVAERRRAEASLTQAYQELKSTQAQLVQSAKLASIGELASGVAHELNQPLMVIRNTAQFIQRSLRKNGGVHDVIKDLDSIEKNTKRMMNIINHLRTFSLQSRPDIQPIDINKVIEDALLMVSEQLHLRNIEMKKNLNSNLPWARGNANQLEQVFLNLISNGRDAIESKVESGLGSGEFIGRIEIETGMSNRMYLRQKTPGTEDRSTDFIEIFVSDNGCGISNEDIGEIFDPFFTTKEVGKGTGLGLSISYGIIKDHEGEIEVIETGPKRTTFRIILPISDSGIEKE